MMTEYRKKPVVIEATQYKLYGVLIKGMCNSTSCYTDGNSQPHVHTIHAGQLVNLEIGDWVIPEPDGKHYYPVKPDIFEATYEKVEDTRTPPEGFVMVERDKLKDVLGRSEFYAREGDQKIRNDDSLRDGHKKNAFWLKEMLDAAKEKTDG